MSFLSCNYFSKNRTGKRITIKHVSVSKLPMICEQDGGSFLNLTDSLLFKSKLWPEAIKIIQDSIQHYYLVHTIVSNNCLIDEVIFPKALLEKIDKTQDIDSLKIIISRDFDNIAFKYYGFVYSSNIDLNISIAPDGFGEIGNQRVKIKEDPATKKLFMVTMNGEKISFNGVVPYRNYIADIRFKEQLIIYYTNKRIYSITISSPKSKNASHLARFAETLQEAKSL